VAEESENWSRPDWWDDAACRGRHDLLSEFVTSAGIDQNRSRYTKQVIPWRLVQMCKHCPVNEICLETGMRDRYAIRGGTTPGQRDAIIRKERRDRAS